MNNQRKWQITLTEEQMYVLIHAVEDWHRFICGQCSMDYATAYIDNVRNLRTVRDILDNKVKPAMFPELEHNQSYSWCGGHSDPNMSKDAAISYMIYREIRHKLTLADKPKHYSVYEDETLTCEEQGPMIDVRLVGDLLKPPITKDWKPEVGMKVYVVYNNFSAKSFYDTISKVGRKYFYVGEFNCKYDIDSKEEREGHVTHSYCYLCEEDYLREKEYKEKYNNIRRTVEESAYWLNDEQAVIAYNWIKQNENEEMQNFRR